MILELARIWCTVGVSLGPASSSSSKTSVKVNGCCGCGATAMMGSCGGGVVGRERFGLSKRQRQARKKEETSQAGLSNGAELAGFVMGGPEDKGGPDSVMAGSSIRVKRQAWGVRRAACSLQMSALGGVAL